MKKLLTTLFAVFVVVSAFATVNVETITPNVYYQGACERVGTMKFIVANDQDYQVITSDQFVLVKIQLTDGATLCKNLFTDANGDAAWGILEVDGNHWTSGDVKAYGAAGANTIYVKICAAPSGTPNANDQAWYILGNTQNVGSNASVFDPHAICVNFQGSTFALNEFFLVSIADYTVTADCADDTVAPTTYVGSFLGTSYSPANPAIAYGQPENSHNFTYDMTCGKNGQLGSSYDVYLCQCYTSDTQNQTTNYECHDPYRVGNLNLHDWQCQVLLKEDSVGMLPVDSVIEFTIVDANGNPVDVYFANVPTLTTDATSGLTLSAGTGIDPVTHDYAMDSDSSLTVGDCEDYDECENYYTDLYASIQYTVTAASTAGPGTIYLEDLDLARLVSDGPVEAYVKVSWYPVPCGTGGSVIIPHPLKFVACKTPEEYEPTYYQASMYFPYFPNSGYWWSGLAITNVNYYYTAIIRNIEEYWYNFNFALGIDQDINITLYLIEEDGDVYVYDAGTLPKSGITTILLSDPSFSPVLMDGYEDDAFGDEKFWVVAVGTATVGDTPIVLDGFGMLGDGTQAQGFLPRIPNWNFDAWFGVFIAGGNTKK